ncbi:MAG: T9SS type A sorting domain-containing protein [Thermoanaerobaculia bacterium]|nr:T9SS type A sorting domain-containing protein [Thermoanaerobaculia bacterium]
MKNILLFCLLLPAYFSHTQTNVRAWYADGQVWVVWQVSLPLPDWYSVYAKPTAFNSTTQATLVGRLHKFEYGCYALKEQTDTSATPRVPGPAGQGTYQLAGNEALFVFTPHQAGSLYFAVVPEGSTTVTTGQNITSAAAPFQYDPLNDPVECHVQKVFPSPFAAGFTCFAFLMWADGRQNQWENRPDFPVMANAAKNGMPGLFFVSVPNGLDTTQPFPLSVWLHGGGGTARQSLAGSRAEVNIKPQAGILLSHDDKMIGWRNLTPPFPTMPTWHFGWRKNYDPFNPGNLPTTPDTIVNYTQRRYLWIDAWLIRHYNIDPARIHIHGHSMGSAGALALAKCYPEHYASCTIFNSGFGGPEPGNTDVIFGASTENFPTNLKNRAGETIRQLSVWNLLENCAQSRDLPLLRHWHSKNDDNGTMHWGAYVVENYRKADSLGIGIQHMWSERGHGIDTGPAYNDHWVKGSQANQNTILDNVAFAENYSRSDQSFPAFFNHRLDSLNNDPGIGTVGINNGDGDNWGAWGGWHRWDPADLSDAPGGWAVTAWLENNAVFANDNCPHTSLKADMAIRRPQNFKPQTGKMFYWLVRDVDSGENLQNGTAAVLTDDVVVIPQVEVWREDIRRVSIEISTTPVAVEEPGNDFQTNIQVRPNPVTDKIYLPENTERVRIFNLAGKTVLESHTPGLAVLDVSALNKGIYFLEIWPENGPRQGGKWIKL